MRKSCKATAIMLSVAMSASSVFMSPIGTDIVHAETAGVTDAAEIAEITGTLGTQLSGWQCFDGKWYYYQDGVPVTGSHRLGTNWYYFTSKGVMYTGWLTVKGKTYYFNTNGARANGLTKVDGDWYYFSTGGVLQKNYWLEYQGKKYYFDANGMRTVGSAEIEGKWYFFDSKGIMKTGWLTAGNGKKYYFGEDGVRTTGLAYIDGRKYYFNAKGIMHTGWLTSKGNVYYFGTDGALRTGWQIIDGKTYRFSSKGVMVRGWTKYNGKIYYLDEDGAMVKKCSMTIDGESYYFDADGVLVATGSFEWILASEAPADATIIEEKWTYTCTEHAESASADLDGWTLVESKTGYSAWSSWKTNPVSADASTEVQTRTVQAHTGYNMEEYNYATTNGRFYLNYAPEDTSVYVFHREEWISVDDLAKCEIVAPGGWSTNGTYTGRNATTDAYGYNIHEGMIYFISSLTYSMETQYRSRKLITTYYFTRTVESESSEYIEEGGDISNVQKWVKCVVK